MSPLNAENSIPFPPVTFGDYNLTAHYQPLVSVAQEMVIGHEGLIRGFHAPTGKPVPPIELFAQAARIQQTQELDRACRKTVTAMFQDTLRKNPELILSVNFDASIPDLDVSGAVHLLENIKSLGLPPSSIMVEVLESAVQNMNGLRRFIDTLRQSGILIAIDDIGAGHSNLNRLSFLKPDVMKIDRFLITNLDNDFYKQEVFRSLVTLARKVGSLILAEGLETREECLAAIDLGADLLQGYYLSKPVSPEQIGALNIKQTISDLAAQHKKDILNKHNIRRANLKRYELMTREIQSKLELSENPEFNALLNGLIRFFPLVECLYVVDRFGLQATDMVYNTCNPAQRNPRLFHPKSKGASHSSRDYFYMLIEGGLTKNTYVTDPYLSLTSGRQCVTFSRLFKDLDGNKNILCADLSAELLESLRFDDNSLKSGA